MESAKSQLDLLKARIKYDADLFGNQQSYNEVLEQLLEDSKNIALSIRFPYQDYSNIPLPTKYYNWQLRCAIELFNGLGKENIKSYAENGISWTRDGSNLSTDLYEEIMPMVGVINENIQ